MALLVRREGDFSPSAGIFIVTASRRKRKRKHRRRRRRRLPVPPNASWRQRRALEEARAQAILEPTPENVTAYLRLQQESLTERRKRSRTPSAARSGRTPSLDYTLRRPVGALAKRLWTEERRAERNAALAEARGALRPHLPGIRAVSGMPRIRASPSLLRAAPRDRGSCRLDDGRGARRLARSGPGPGPRRAAGHTGLRSCPPSSSTTRRPVRRFRSRTASSPRTSWPSASSPSRPGRWEVTTRRMAIIRKIQALIMVLTLYSSSPPRARTCYRRWRTSGGARP